MAKKVPACSARDFIPRAPHANSASGHCRRFAAEKFDGDFSDSSPLEDEGIAAHIIREVCKRTPGYIPWQQERWLSHCQDACEFHGDVPVQELLEVTGEELETFLFNQLISQQQWDQLINSYGTCRTAVYKFNYRQCGKIIYDLDCS
ncbi:CbrC family protein [Oleidesulfovibrio sp.]|uniref:CbrC family protein n=1 Tax=Oleidesulfovibrio sp. TaxID=2909707 RepID=UPI003A8ACCCF